MDVREKRLIEATPLVAKFENAANFYIGPAAAAFHEALEAVQTVPTVDAVEVVHGRWDTTACEQAGTLTAFTHHCPNCNYLYKDLHYKGHNYCPNCGAKMDGDGNG